MNLKTTSTISSKICIGVLVPAVPGISYILQIIPLTSDFLGSTWFFFLRLIGIPVYYHPRT
ncbi:hypothetical protein B0H14DRAFT_819302 [Mycena olivaceomarginata]|nr:hypothetical protein B0H14DRAFT_819302 [Mycena olivaceomarginata]